MWRPCSIQWTVLTILHCSTQLCDLGVERLDPFKPDVLLEVLGWEGYSSFHSWVGLNMSGVAVLAPRFSDAAAARCLRTGTSVVLLPDSCSSKVARTRAAVSRGVLANKLTRC
ncbi:hypothetical protein F444_06809 [Phytophthora nicotianae P1976]|uniref:AMP-dependent synthetase/ligase domain-containing protein n=1 Tax=Phytophthora nicotianae P1976 TaxID=1317066 RepID=A0A081AH04_PHYNI|nr:hypothetical protein F444_06809 [Phytophthora nicotianae P1976]